MEDPEFSDGRHRGGGRRAKTGGAVVYDGWFGVRLIVCPREQTGRQVFRLFAVVPAQWVESYGGRWDNWQGEHVLSTQTLKRGIGQDFHRDHSGNTDFVARVKRFGVDRES